MATPLVLLAALRHCVFTAMIVFIDLSRLIAFGLRSRRALAAENLFLRKQMALFQERKIKPRRADDSTRWMMATLIRMFQWRDALWNVKPDTLNFWHRKGFRLFWRGKSKPTGRPSLPNELRQLIREMAAGNATWGEERIANELKLKLGIRRIASQCRKVPARRWTGSHARSEAAVADFRPQPCPGDRGVRLLRCGHRHVPNSVRIRRHGSGHPQNPASQCDRPPDGGRDHATVPRGALRRPCVSVRHSRPRQHFSKELDKDVTAMGVRVLRTPFRAPTSNSFCERFGGTLAANVSTS